MTMKAYLINLDSRKDRLVSSIEQLKNFAIDFERIPAVSVGSDFSLRYPHVTPHVAAIWLSHMEALTAFLKSGEDYTLILEDDFVFDSSREIFMNYLDLSTDFDLLQIGFLTTNSYDWVELKVTNFIDLALKGIYRYSKLRLPWTSKLQTKFLVYDQESVRLEVVKNDFRSGAHAYIVRREFAQKLLGFNNPVLFSADQFLVSLAKMKSFSFARLRRSIVRQSNSPSSVQLRFTSQRN